ncbi:hypothetical protein TNCV_443621 [Trichonephila clavipes]|nr:hypothetical protein TNCV_443621 [Trichonephila clavipes]
MEDFPLGQNHAYYGESYNAMFGRMLSHVSEREKPNGFSLTKDIPDLGSRNTRSSSSVSNGISNSRGSVVTLPGLRIGTHKWLLSS